MRKCFFAPASSNSTSSPTLRLSSDWAMGVRYVTMPFSGSESQAPRIVNVSVCCVPNSVTFTRVPMPTRSEEHTSELQSRSDLVCRLLLEKKKKDLSDRTEDSRHN